MRIIQNGVYRIETVRGKVYCLKRMPYPPTKLRWIDRTLQRLRQNSNLRLGWRNPKTREGRLLYARSGLPDAPPFVLIPWLRGKWPSPRSKKQMKACGILLAKFHQAGQRIPRPASGRYSTAGTWMSHLLAERRKLRRIVRKGKRGGHRSPLDRMLQQHGDQILKWANQSIAMLKRSGYRTYSRSGNLVLCHGDFGPTNLIRTKKGLYLIDFEAMRYDLGVYDLYRLLYNAGQVNHWNFKLARSILDGYRQIRPIGRTDYRILKALLRFPRETCKLIEYYDKNGPVIKRRIERLFPQVFMHERNRKVFLAQLEKYRITRGRK